MGKRVFAFLSILMMLVAVLPFHALAIAPIDLNREVSLTVTFQDGKLNIPNVRFDLYRVADSTEFAVFTLSGDFSKYPVAINDLDTEGWKNTASTLAAYAKRDQISPTDTGVTGSDGRVTFPAGETKLLPGLYLVVGESCYADGCWYNPEPFLISLPNRMADAHEWDYAVETGSKYNRVPVTEIPDTVMRKALKVWVDEGGTVDHPQSIEVQLLKNGEVYDTVTLSAENDWRYTWSNLPSGVIWQVVEKTVPEGYAVSVSQEGVTFVVTNTTANDTQDPTPTPEVTPPPTNPTEPGAPILPQTGMLWWPVPLMICGGLLLFIIGWVRSQKQEEPDEE